MIIIRRIFRGIDRPTWGCFVGDRMVLYGPYDSTVREPATGFLIFFIF